MAVITSYKITCCKVTSTGKEGEKGTLAICGKVNE
jgi:hypothetical protein